MSTALCVSCEVTPAAPDDILCALCRQWVNDNTTMMTDPVEIILNRHQAIHTPDYGRICHCNEEFDTPAAYRHHVAERIYQVLGIRRPGRSSTARRIVAVAAISIVTTCIVSLADGHGPVAGFAIGFGVAAGCIVGRLNSL